VKVTEKSDIPKEMNRFQDSVEDALRQIRGCPLLDGAYILNQTAVSSEGIAVVEHGLGRAWQGYVITRRTGAVEFSEDISNDAVDRSARLRLTTTFHPGAPSTISYDIWVF
jgi:hypothetical protein